MHTSENSKNTNAIDMRAPKKKWPKDHNMHQHLQIANLFFDNKIDD